MVTVAALEPEPFGITGKFERPTLSIRTVRRGAVRESSPILQRRPTSSRAAVRKGAALESARNSGSSRIKPGVKSR